MLAGEQVDIKCEHPEMNVENYKFFKNNTEVSSQTGSLVSVAVLPGVSVVYSCSFSTSLHWQSPLSGSQVLVATGTMFCTAS